MALSTRSAKGDDKPDPKDTEGSQAGRPEAQADDPKSLPQHEEGAPDVTTAAWDPAGLPDVNAAGPEYNPTTPDGKPPVNNLPGPHGPQGPNLEDPAEG